MSGQIDLNRFLKDALTLAEKASTAEKILTAAQGGVIETEAYRREIAPGYDGQIRQLIKEVVFAIWSEYKRPATLSEIYNGIGLVKIPGVVSKIHDSMASGEWPKIWNFPSKRTSDRRTNELASSGRTMWGDLPFQPLICLKAGHYQPNPRFFDEESRDAIASAAEP